MKKKGGRQMSEPVFQEVEPLTLDRAIEAMEQAVIHERPRIVASRMTDAELAADFKRRLYEALVPVGAIADEMKSIGLGFNMAWNADTFGRHIPTVTVIRSYP